MNPAKPAAQTPPPPAGAQTPLAPRARPHAPIGPLFAHVLAAHLPAPRKVGPPLPGAPEDAHEAKTALPEAVRGLAEEPKELGRHGHHPSRREDDELDPSARQAAQLGPPMIVAPRQDQAQAASTTNARVSLEDLVPQLVKKIAWSGDAQRGTVRMELGAGELSGATLVVSAEHGRVSVRVDAPPGTDTSAWRDRLAARLEARGLDIESVEVR